MLLIIAQYYFTDIFAGFNDGLSKSAVAAMDYQNLLWPQWRTALLQLTIYRCMFWTDHLIVLATNLSDVDDQNKDDVGEPSNRAGGEMDTDSRSCPLHYQSWVMMRSLIFVRRKMCL